MTFVLFQAYMFKYDSTHSPFKGSIKVVDVSTLEINGKQTKWQATGKRKVAGYKNKLTDVKKLHGKKIHERKKMPTKIKKPHEKKLTDDKSGTEKIVKTKKSAWKKLTDVKSCTGKKIANVKNWKTSHCARDRLGQNSQEGSLWLARLADGSGYQITMEYLGITLLLKLNLVYSRPKRTMSSCDVVY